MFEDPQDDACTTGAHFRPFGRLSHVKTRIRILDEYFKNSHGHASVVDAHFSEQLFSHLNMCDHGQWPEHFKCCDLLNWWKANGSSRCLSRHFDTGAVALMAFPRYRKGSMSPV